ncbi:MAG TPA: hypothetical protein VGF92_05430 [Stellaceae bacterium]|jgi:hypothetical protein
MSAGLVPIDVSIAAPASGTFESGAENDLGLSFNPGFVVGPGFLTQSGTASPSASSSQESFPSSSSPATALANPPAGIGLSTLNTALPNSAGALATTSTASSSLLLWLLIGGAAILLLSGGKR